MPLFGLKLGLGEKALVKPASSLWREGVFDFLELYVRPGSTRSDCALWTWYDGPLVLHAPHSSDGFNFARAEKADGNRRIIEMVDAVREHLSPRMVIFHPGLDGSKAESFRQLALLRRDFPELHRVLLLENKPYWGLDLEICLGASPADIGELLKHAGCGFCLDVRHAFAYAAEARQPWNEVVAELAALSPRLWHAADGISSSLMDSHLHIGDGDMPWKEIAGFWDGETMVTIECRKDPKALLQDFRDDLNRLRNAINTDLL